MNVRRLILVAGAAAVVLTGAGTGAAWAGSPIGPNQHFTGLVNGMHTGAVIYVVCAGPARTGPPKAGQTFAVHQVAQGSGDTGAGAHMLFGYLPGGPPAIVSLRSYDSPGAIPTRARIPCGGTGTVYFTPCPLPQPCGRGAKPDDVQVTFINIGVGR